MKFSIAFIMRTLGDKVNNFFTLGFLVQNYDHEPIYLTNIADRAKLYGIKCVMFKPEDVQFESLVAKGKTFNPFRKAWESDYFPLPPFIYDRCFYRNGIDFEKTKKLVKQLKKYGHILFLNYGLPDKWSLYCVLKNTNIKPFLPDTYLVRNSEEVAAYVKQNKCCILKPVTGAGGTGIVAVFYYKEQFFLKYIIQNKQKVRIFFQHNNMKQFMNHLLKKNAYLLQPLLPLRNKKNEPFDIRIFIQKNFIGNWVIQGIGVRVGEKNTFVSNLAKGAKVLSFNKWLKKKHLTLQDKIVKDMKQMINTLLPILDEHYSPLFEIGLDIGFDPKKEKLWILDINSKPGRKIVLQTNPSLETQLYDTPLLYAQYLFNLKLRKDGTI